MDDMSTSRMDKYKNIDEELDTQKRTTKNKNIYEDIKTTDYENINLSSNVSVIEAPMEEMNLDNIKKILDDKYNTKQKKDVSCETLEVETTEEIEDTKEYDLKKVLEEAHKNKTTDYDHDRFMKLRETQYDILKSLNIEESSHEQDKNKTSKDDTNLMNLIETVNYNASKNKSSTEENDLFSDLMGTDATDTLEPMTFDDDTTSEVTGKKRTIVEELERTKQLSKTEINGALLKYEEENADKVNDSIENKSDEEDKLSNSFYTGKLQISKKDLDDFKDLEGDMTSGNVAIKILIAIIILVVLGLIIFLLNKYLNLELF